MNRLRAWDLTLLVFITLLLLSSNVLAQESIDKQIQELEGKLETLQKQVMKFGAQQSAISRIENLEHKVGSLDQLPVLEQRFETLEREVSKRASTAATDVHAVTEVAKMTMASYESKFDIVSKAAMAMYLAIVVIFAISAYLGIRNVRQVTKPLRKDHRKLMREIEGARKEHAELTKNLKSLQDGAHANVEGLIHTASAFTYVEHYRVAGEKGEEWLRRASWYLKKTLKEIKPTNQRILVWAHTINGYVLLRAKGSKQALQSLECAIELDPEHSSHMLWFNAACYAALEGQKEKCLQYLETAIDRDSVAKQMAIDDSHFDDVRDDPQFGRLTAQD